MPVEVVGGDVRVDRDGRAARQRRQLQLGQLVDDPVVGRQLGQPLDERDPDVPAEDDRVGRVGGQDGRGQRRGRGLALRPGHADRRRRAQAQEQVRLGHEGRDASGRRRARASTSARSAARRRGSVVGKSGVIDGEVATSVGVRPGRGRVDVRPQREASPAGPPSAAIASPSSSAGRPS